MNVSTRWSDLRRPIFAALTCAIALAIFFRQQLQNGFAFLSSDRFDGAIELSLLEHWHNVLRGLATWHTPNYFYPYSKVLAFNDGYFLYGLVFSVYRWLGMDIFLAGEFVNISVKLIGFVSFAVAAERMLRVPRYWALLGATLFTISNATYQQIIHAQLLSVAFLPLFALLLHAAYLALMAGQRTRFLVYGSVAGLFYGAWLMTSAYMAWFFLLFFALFLAAAALLPEKGTWRRIGNALLALKLEVLVVAVVAAGSLLPFAWIYMLGHHGPRSWAEVAFYLPSLADTINVGDDNLLLGRFMQFIRQSCTSCKLGVGENVVGFAPVLLALGIGGIVHLSRRFKQYRRTDQLAMLIAAAVVVCWMLAIQIGDLTLWSGVYRFWPGATGLRVVSRLFIFLSAPLIMVAVWYAAKWLDGARWPVVAILAALLVVEEVNQRVTVGIDRQGMLSRLDATRAPEACTAFFTTSAPDSDTAADAAIDGRAMPHNIDAMLIAELINLPTINGFASFTPDDWNFDRPGAGDYPARIAQYAQAHGLAGLCRLDLHDLQWSRAIDAPAASSRLLSVAFAAGAAHEGIDLQGFDAAEKFGRWSLGTQARLNYTLRPEARPRRLRLVFATALITGSHPQRLRVKVDGAAPKEFLFVDGGRRIIDIRLPEGGRGSGHVLMEFPDATSPKALGINADGRALAVGIERADLY